MVRRLGVFVFFDRDGIVDDYVVYLLKNLSACLSHLVIVVNGSVTAAGRAKLAACSQDIILRKNYGFDAGAWQEVLVNRIGKAKLVEYDELVLLNDTFYGPFEDFSTVFAEMDQREPEKDFWGITIHGELPGSDISEHIQTYFIVVRRRLLQDAAFFAYWENMSAQADILDAILKNEVYFTKYFAERGFSYGAYCDTRLLEQGWPDQVNQYLFNVDTLLRKMHCPILKKKALVLTGPDKEIALRYCNSLEGKKAMDFIEENTAYPVGYIWDNLLRVSKLQDIVHGLRLNFFPEEKPLPAGCEAAVAITLLRPDRLELLLPHLSRLPSELDVHFFVSEGVDVRTLQAIVPAAMFYVLKDDSLSYEEVFWQAYCQLRESYAYLCFVNDDGLDGRALAVTVGAAVLENKYENLLGDGAMIGGILALFEQQKSLGVLGYPLPFVGPYLCRGMDAWCVEDELDATDVLAQVLRLDEGKVDGSLPPLLLEPSFWCRTKALTGLKCPKKPSVLIRGLRGIVPYLAQRNRFYFGCLYSKQYASAAVESYRYMYDLAQPDLSMPTAWVPRLKHFAKHSLPAPAVRMLRALYRRHKKKAQVMLLDRPVNEDMFLRVIGPGVQDSLRLKKKSDFSLQVPLGFDFSLKTDKIAALVHLFYVELASDIKSYLENIPCRADVFISTDTEEKKKAIEHCFRDFTRGSVEVRICPNRGRDIAPLLVGFRDVYDRYDVCVHLHSKKSPHASDKLHGWRDYFYESLLGSREIVSSILHLLEQPAVGVVFPQYFSASLEAINWGGDYPAVRKLLLRAGIELRPGMLLEFPAGSMFWFRSEAIRPLLELGLQVEDFPEELGQIDGTIAHAIERSFLFAAESAGCRWVKISASGQPVPDSPVLVSGTEEELQQNLQQSFHPVLKNYM